MSSDNKPVALVTGARTGIGRAIAEKLLEQNYKVYGTSRNGFEDGNIQFVAMDVTSEESVKEAINGILNSEHRIDVLVNNAGNAVVGPLAKSTTKDLQKQLEVNVLGVHRVVSEVLPKMQENGGTIVNIGSFGGRLALPFQGLYSMSKAGLAMYTDALRMELFKSKVRVCLIEPGDTKTEFDSGRIHSEHYNPEEDMEAAKAIDIMRESESKGVDPKVVAKTVWKAVKAKRPKPRYLTGPDAKGFGLLQRFLPFKLQERLIMSTYKVPRK